MKIYIRGGAWTNVEDSILMAAYMKYGGNQWLRIASLLARKSPSQVKARWYEYLDPTLRKTPWTPKEDEKLIHLAKSMPMQWKTISQYFGRSAYQCSERYKELIDKSTNTKYIEDNAAAIEHEMMPNFETLDAIPDPIELDKDEKEMLEETRARLANTQGKKARRKARERQLEVLRQLAKKQKKKELLESGLIIEERNEWEDEEFDMDVLTTHSAKKGRFETDEEDKRLKQERLSNIKKKINERKKKEESLNKLKHELKVEEQLQNQTMVVSKGELSLPDPKVSAEEISIIESLRNQGKSLLDSDHSLSLMKKSNKSITIHNTRSVNEVPIINMPICVEKGLPRPNPVDISILNENSLDNIDRLIIEEALHLQVYDALKFPDVEKPPVCLVYPIHHQIEQQLSQVENIGPSLLTKAELMIIDEMKGEEPDYDRFSEIWDQLHQDDQNYNITKELSRLNRKVESMNKQYFQSIESASLRNDHLFDTLNEETKKLFKILRSLEIYQRNGQIESSTLKARLETIQLRVDELEKKQISLDREYSKKQIEMKKQKNKRTL